MTDPVKSFSDDSVIMLNTKKVTAPFRVPPWAVFCGVFIPAIADADITLEISKDGTNYYPLLDPIDGADLIVCASGSDPGWVDISDYIRFAEPSMYLRLVASVAANADETFEIQFAG